MYIINIIMYVPRSKTGVARTDRYILWISLSMKLKFEIVVHVIPYINVCDKI